MIHALLLNIKKAFFSSTCPIKSNLKKETIIFDL